jgi:hypothetical protein
MDDQKYGLGDDHADFTRESKDALVSFLHKVIRQAVRVLAVLMTLVILWGILDVMWVLYQNIMAPPKFLLNLNDILATFSAFLAVLIAIEIFINITMYLRRRDSRQTGGGDRAHGHRAQSGGLRFQRCFGHLCLGQRSGGAGTGRHLLAAGP